MENVKGPALESLQVVHFHTPDATHKEYIEIDEGLNLWGLSESDSSYPYRGYIQVVLELPEKAPGMFRRLDHNPPVSWCSPLSCSQKLWNE